jgi:hypothetical protein
MAEKRKLEFFLLRYVPDAVKGEFVNFGLAMIEWPGSRGGTYAELRCIKDWNRVLRADPQADIDMLKALVEDTRKRVVEVRNCAEVVKVLNDSFSNAIQLSEPQGCLTENPEQEIEVMAGIYLEPRHIGTARELTARERIVLAMSDAWEAVGISLRVKAFPVAPYTGEGDSFKFDFGYRLGEQIRLFHAVSLKARVDSAVTLAARYPKIADAMKTGEKNPLIPSLTAVVDNDLDRTKAEIGFALGMMRENGIRVSEVREMPTIAEEARREIGE